MQNKLTITPTPFKDLYIITPNSFKDERGSFSRVFCSSELKEIFNFDIKQINHSITKDKGTFRGLHFQYEPNAEIKMVKCIKGSILDIVVDIRKNSPTFLKHFAVELSEQNQKMIYVPKGFAHGFQTLEDNTELIYLHSSVYTPLNEGALNIKDPSLKINLPLDIIQISRRDLEHSFITDDFIGIQIDEL